MNKGSAGDNADIPNLRGVAHLCRNLVTGCHRNTADGFVLTTSTVQLE